MELVKITSKNPLPVSADTDHYELIELWTTVEDFFASTDVAAPNGMKVRLSLNAGEIKQRLRESAPENCSEYLEHFFWDLALAGGDPITSAPFRSAFTIGIPEDTFKNTHERDFFVRRVIETLFLAMNLSVPDGCNLPYLTYFSGLTERDVNRSLSNHVIESAWHLAHKEGWPRLEKICFKQVWCWLQEQNALSYVLADSAATKAIAVLARLSYQNDLEITDIVQISQVLESFLLTKDEPKGRGLRRKVQAVLGESKQAQAWAVNFYKLRSQIVHGDFPLFHPLFSESDAAFESIAPQYWEISEALNISVAALLALLQDLIKSGSSCYTFEETLSVRRIS